MLILQVEFYNSIFFSKHSFVEQEARSAVIDMIAKAEEEAMNKELIRIANEAATEESEDDLESEARDKFDSYEQ